MLNERDPLLLFAPSVSNALLLFTPIFTIPRKGLAVDPLSAYPLHIVTPVVFRPSGQSAQQDKFIVHFNYTYVLHRDETVRGHRPSVRPSVADKGETQSGDETIKCKKKVHFVRLLQRSYSNGRVRSKLSPQGAIWKSHDADGSHCCLARTWSL